MIGTTMAVTRIHIATNNAFVENSAPIDRETIWLDGCVWSQECAVFVRYERLEMSGVLLTLADVHIYRI